MDDTYLDNLGIEALGLMVFYSVDSAASVGYEKFRDLIREHQAPLTIMKAPKPENVFRRATEALEFTMELDKWTNPVRFFIKDDGFHKTLVQRSLYAESEFDSGDTSATKIASVTLNKKNKEITWETEPHITSDSALYPSVELAEFYVALYMEENAESLYALPIRESIRRAIDGPLCGTSMKMAGGGVYFIPKSKFTEYLAMAEVVDAIMLTELEAVPCIREPETQCLVEAGFYYHFYTEVTDIENELDKLSLHLNLEETVSAKRFTEIEDRLTALKTKLEAYTWIPKTDGASDMIKELHDDLDRLIDGDEDE